MDKKTENIIWEELLGMHLKDEENMNEKQKYVLYAYAYAHAVDYWGFENYIDSYNDGPEMTYRSLLEVGNEAIADNFMRAYNARETRDFYETDMEYRSFDPELFDLIVEYIYEHSEDIIGYDIKTVSED